jgi:hypothetical protein
MIDYNLFMIYELCWMKLYEKEVVRKENSITNHDAIFNDKEWRSAGGRREQATGRQAQGGSREGRKE